MNTPHTPSSPTPQHSRHSAPHCLKGLIFDCDGVLFDSKGANIAYYNHIRQALGLAPMSEHEAAYAHMASCDEVFAATIPPHLQQAAGKARAAVSYQEQFMPMMEPIPQMRAVLEHLRAKKLRLALCTNRTDSVHGILDHFQLSSFFRPVMTISHVLPKPAPDGLLRILDAWGLDPRNVAYVGDSIVDEQAAACAGIPFWSCGNQDLRAKLYFSSFQNLAELLEPLLDYQA